MVIPKKYKCLSNQNYDFYNYSLIPIRKQDIQLIKTWRNQQMKILRQKKLLSSEDQKNYFDNTIIPTFSQTKPKLILFSFLKNYEIIGYGGFVNMDWKNKISEISFLVDTNRVNSSNYTSDFSAFIKILKKITCKELKFFELFTETYDIRPTHIKVLEKNEFKIKNMKKNGIEINGKRIDILLHSYICNNQKN